MTRINGGASNGKGILEAFPFAALCLSGSRITAYNVAARDLLGEGQDLPEDIGLLLGPENVKAPDRVDRLFDGVGRWRHIPLGRGQHADSTVCCLTRLEQPELAEGPGTNGNEGSHLLVVVPSRANDEAGISSLARSLAEGAIVESFMHVAHELKTPLNAIIGFSEVMQQELFGPLSERYRGYAADILKSAQHLGGVLENMVEAARKGNDDAPPTDNVVDPRQLIEEALRLVQPLISKRQARISVDVADEIRLVVVDHRMFLQALTNLLSNALKYGPNGGEVRIACTLVGTGEAVVSIADQGVGMTPDELHIAMAPFGRTQGALRSGEEGTGLGLVIAKRLMERHHGRLELASRQGAGTVASLILPSYRLVELSSLAPSH